MITQQTDNLIYHGKVNLNLKIKDKIISVTATNNGENHLFKNLVIALVTGTYSAIPAYIGLYSETDSYANPINNGSAVSALTEKTYLQSTDWIARFGTIISHSQTGDIDISKDHRFYLLDSNKNKLAYVQLDNSETSALSKLTAGVSALIEWNMFFSNGSSNLAEFDNITSNITSE